MLLGRHLGQAVVVHREMQAARRDDAALVLQGRAPDREPGRTGHLALHPLLMVRWLAVGQVRTPQRLHGIGHARSQRLGGLGHQPSGPQSQSAQKIPPRQPAPATR